MLLVAPMSTRFQFGDLLDRLGLRGGAVEVGTHRGEFAVRLLEYFPGKLYCVDPWGVPPGYEEQAAYLDGPTMGKDRDDDYVAAKARLKPYHDRVLFMRHLSADAAPLFGDGSLDFVYIDGDHREAMVRLDLDLWWPKVKPGGILAGHDFLCPGERGGGWGQFIQPAVLDFARREGVDVELVAELGGMPWSFLVRKS